MPEPENSYQEVVVGDDGPATPVPEDIADIPLEVAQDVVEEWVATLGGNIQDNYQRLERSWVRPNPWNPNKQDEFMYAHQLEVMRQTGQVAPIIVRRVGPDNSPGHGHDDEAHYQIVDGEHRWRAAGDLGWDQISVNDLGVVPDTVARMITVIMNHVRGESDPLDLGRLFRGLRDDAAGDRRKLERMTRWMPFREREIDVLVDAVRRDRLSAELPKKKHRASDEAWVTFRFRLSREAAAVCTRAMETVTAMTGCTTDRAFELVCADYMAGVRAEAEAEAAARIAARENDDADDS